MKTFLTLLLLAAIPTVFGCWAISRPIMISLDAAGGTGLVCVDAAGTPQLSGTNLRIAIRRVRINASIIKTNTETGEQVWEDDIVEYGGPTGPNYELYIYRLNSAAGGTAIGSLLETRQITPAEFSANQTALTTVGTPAELFADFPGEGQLFLSLQPRTAGAPAELGGTGVRGLYYQMILSRSGTANTTTRKKVDFSGCSLSVPGTILPLTPTLTVAPVTVTTGTYGVVSILYKASNAAMTSRITDPQGPLDVELETTTYTAPVTAARLTVTDADGDRETFSAAALQTGSSLPVWGRYSIAPWGIATGEQLKFDLVLTADGINSNQATDALTVVTPPAVSTATITVTGDNRPER